MHRWEKSKFSRIAKCKNCFIVLPPRCGYNIAWGWVYKSHSKPLVLNPIKFRKAAAWHSYQNIKLISIYSSSRRLYIIVNCFIVIGKLVTHHRGKGSAELLLQGWSQGFLHSKRGRSSLSTIQVICGTFWLILLYWVSSLPKNHSKAVKFVRDSWADCAVSVSVRYCTGIAPYRTVRNCVQLKIPFINTGTLQYSRIYSTESHTLLEYQRDWKIDESYRYRVRYQVPYPKIHYC